VSDTPRFEAQRPISVDPDHALMLRIAGADMLAYRELVDRHLDRSVRVAERMLGNRQDAEDIVQEVCLKVWKEAPRWRPQAKFSTWLYRVLVNACIDWRRKVVPFVDTDMDGIEDGRCGDDERLIEQEDSRRVRDALQTLPARQRAAVVLSYYEELTNQQAADVLGLTLGAFQQLLFRAKQKLKGHLTSPMLETEKELEDERR